MTKHRSAGVRSAASCKRTAFAQHLMRDTRLMCVLAYIYIAANYLVAPLHRHDLLLLPYPAQWTTWLVEYGLVSGGCAALVVFRWLASDHVLAPRVTFVLTALVGLGVVASTAVWRSTGAYFFSDLTYIYLFLMAAVSGLQFGAVVCVSAVICIAHFAASVAVNGWVPTSRFELLAAATAMGVVSIVSWHLTTSRLQAWTRGQHFQQLSLEDELTGLLNRRGFNQQAQLAFQEAARTDKPVALAVLDLDHFKAFNDTHGHAGGDTALRAMSKVLTGSARQANDVVARIGGEEFAVLWVDLSADLLRIRVGRLLDAVRRVRVCCDGRPETVSISVSIGAVSTSVDADTRVDALVGYADRLLYEAKAQGRDRAVIRALPASPPLAPGPGG